MPTTYKPTQSSKGKVRLWATTIRNSQLRKRGTCRSSTPIPIIQKQRKNSPWQSNSQLTLAWALKEHWGAVDAPKSWHLSEATLPQVREIWSYWDKLRKPHWLHRSLDSLQCFLFLSEAKSTTIMPLGLVPSLSFNSVFKILHSSDDPRRWITPEGSQQPKTAALKIKTITGFLRFFCELLRCTTAGVGGYQLEWRERIKIQVCTSVGGKWMGWHQRWHVGSLLF